MEKKSLFILIFIILTPFGIASLEIFGDDTDRIINLVPDAVANGGSSGSSEVNITYIRTFWAEENGGLNSNNYEWSFGNGAVGSLIGINTSQGGKLVNMSFQCATAGSNTNITIRVNGAYACSVTSSASSGTASCDYDINAGDFMTPYTAVGGLASTCVVNWDVKTTETYDVAGGSAGGNIFDQWLNTTNNVQFQNITADVINGSHVYGSVQTRCFSASHALGSSTSTWMAVFGESMRYGAHVNTYNNHSGFVMTSKGKIISAYARLFGSSGTIFPPPPGGIWDNVIYINDTCHNNQSLHLRGYSTGTYNSNRTVYNPPIEYVEGDLISAYLNVSWGVATRTDHHFCIDLMEVLE